MITAQQYRNSPGALHDSYYREIAQEAAIVVPTHYLRRFAGLPDQATFAGTPDDAWQKIIEPHREAIHAALQARSDYDAPLKYICAAHAAVKLALAARVKQ